jgi:putative IMPACT (imprinted ancient) family translation regulator
VAQAVLAAEKVPLVKQAQLACSVPYALEGLVRRELEAAGAHLLDVQHSSVVSFELALPEHLAAGLVSRLSESGRGQLVWLAGDRSGLTLAG